MNKNKYEKHEYLRDVLKNTIKKKQGRIGTSTNVPYYDIISLRYGFYGEPKTLKECGEHFNVSQERFRQVEAKVIEFIRVRFSQLGLSGIDFG
tara:strand:+ start:177 stop:455 length:279 start_codon:yes stop_codon:yes gene_type:complete